MLTKLIQITVAFGPVVLAVMGLALSIAPPSPTGRVRYIWAVAFAAVGAGTAISSFCELRGSDEILGQIWGRVSAIKGPRLEFSGIKAKPNVDGYTTLGIGLINTSEVDATGYELFGSIFIGTEHAEEQISQFFTEAKSQTSKLVIQSNDSTTPISRGMGLTLPLKSRFPDTDANVRNLYVVLLATYVGKNTPQNHVWITEICAKITRAFDTFEACPSHNGYFYTDKNLSSLP